MINSKFEIRNSKLWLLVIIWLLVVGDWSFSFTNNKSSPTIEWTQNGIIISNAKGNSTQKNPKIAKDGRGVFIVVWEDDRDGYFNIYAQKIGSSKIPEWQEGGIEVCAAPKNQTRSEIINDGEGGVIIVWEDYRGGNADIYAQRIDEFGGILWEKDGVPICRAPAGQFAPKLVSDGSGGAIIVWYDYRGGAGEDIYAQRISKNGEVLWKVDGIPICIEGGTQWYPEIVSDGNGGAIIVWTDFRNPSQSDIYAQRVDATGKIIWKDGGIPISSAPENQAYPKITEDGEGGAIIVWADYREGNSDIYAQRITGDGKALFPPDGIPISKELETEKDPQIIGDGKGGAIIAWITEKTEDTSYIYAQRIDSIGKALWGEGKIVTGAPLEKNHIQMVGSRRGGTIITWEDMRFGNTSIYAQKLNASGLRIWEEDGLKVRKEKENGELPQLVQDENDGAVIVWQDQRDGNYDIYAQWILGNGSYLWKDSIIVDSSIGSVAQQNPKIAYDGKNGFVIVWEDYRGGFPSLYAQRVNEEGRLTWSSDGIIVSPGPGIKQNPQLVNDGNSSFIAFEERREEKIYIQKISNAGERMWKGDGIPVSTSKESQRNPKITSDGKGGIIVAFEQTGKEGKDIYAQRIGPQGELLFKKEGVPVSIARGDQESVRIIGDGLGGGILVWVDYRNGLANPDIYAQRIKDDGKPAWQENGVPVCRAPDIQRDPEEVTDGIGGAIIFWSDKGGGGYDIYAQRIDGSGKVYWIEDGVPVCQAEGTQKEGRAISDDEGGAIVIFEDYRSHNWDIYAQRINKDGNLMWEASGVPISTAPLTQYAPKITKDGSSGGVIVWEDYRGGLNYNIFAQRINKEGKILWLEDGVPICADDHGARSPDITSDMKGSFVFVWEDYRSGGYDIYSQKIKITKIK